jgi:chemotaxis protein methyltransferase WspC
MKKVILENIRNYIEAKTGIDIDQFSSYDYQDAIDKRLKRTQQASLQDYFHYLQSSSAEFEQLVELIVIPETWFFREARVFEYLVQYVKKQIQVSTHSHVKPHFRFLSLPCSTGEEPYSIIIALHRADISSCSYHVDAIDISNAAIQKAKKGIYSCYSFRGKKLDFISSYFTSDKKEAKFILKSFLKKNITFKAGNALDSKFLEKQGGYDIILCRNLLIYFNSEAQEQLLKILYKNLKPNGRLIVATAELYLALSAGFIPEQDPFGFILYKPQRAAPHDLSINAPMNIPTGNKELNPVDMVSKPLLQNSLQEAIELADQGELEKAERLCRQYLAKHKNAAEPYYLLGVIEGVRGNDKASEQYFLKTVYLNPNHYEALIHLALIAESKNKIDQGKLFRLRAQKAVNLTTERIKITRN